MRVGGVPTISQQELQYLRYRPEVKNFDDGDTTLIRNYENRERAIKDLDTGMSPFMKNQNEFFQRMKDNVAR